MKKIDNVISHILYIQYYVECPKKDNDIENYLRQNYEMKGNVDLL